MKVWVVVEGYDGYDEGYAIHGIFRRRADAEEAFNKWLNDNAKYDSRYTKEEARKQGYYCTEGIVCSIEEHELQ